MGKKAKTQPPKRKAATRPRKAKTQAQKPKHPVHTYLYRGKERLGPLEKKREAEAAKKALAEKRAVETMKPSLLFSSVVAEIKKEYKNIDQLKLVIDSDYKRGPIMETFAAAVNKVLAAKQRSLGIKFDISTIYRQSWGDKANIEVFCLIDRSSVDEPRHFLVARDEAAMGSLEIPLYKDDLLELYRKIVL